jgi:hypothetical protein
MGRVTAFKPFKRIDAATLLRSLAAVVPTLRAASLACRHTVVARPLSSIFSSIRVGADDLAPIPAAEGTVSRHGDRLLEEVD